MVGKTTFKLSQSVRRHLHTDNPAEMMPSFRILQFRAPDADTAKAIFEDFCGDYRMNNPTLTDEDLAMDYLKLIAEDGWGEFATSTIPSGVRKMGHRQREMWIQFNASVAEDDPQGEKSKLNEYVRSFQEEEVVEEGVAAPLYAVVPASELIYSEEKAGFAAQASLPWIPGAFGSIHLHPTDGPEKPGANSPSGMDLFTGRDMNFEYNILKGADKKAYLFTRSLPPRFYELEDAGPGLRSAPVSPDILPEAAAGEPPHLEL
jgi:hypothetical protein